VELGLGHPRAPHEGLLEHDDLGCPDAGGKEAAEGPGVLGIEGRCVEGAEHGQKAGIGLLVLGERVAAGVERAQPEPLTSRDLDYLLVSVSSEPHLDGAVQCGGENRLLDPAVQGSLGGERDAELIGGAVAEGELVPGEGKRVPAEHGDRLDDAPEPSCGYDTVPLQLAAAQPSTVVPASEKQIAAQWQQWLSQQHLTGPTAVPDYANPEQMNRYTWYATHGWRTPYPGDSKIYAPNQVPGAYVPASDTSGQ